MICLTKKKKSHENCKILRITNTFYHNFQKNREKKLQRRGFSSIPYLPAWITYHFVRSWSFVSNEDVIRIPWYSDQRLRDCHTSSSAHLTHVEREKQQCFCHFLQRRLAIKWSLNYWKLFAIVIEYSLYHWGNKTSDPHIQRNPSHPSTPITDGIGNE